MSWRAFGWLAGLIGLVSCGSPVVWELPHQASRFKRTGPILIVPEVVDGRPDAPSTGRLAPTWIPGVFSAETRADRPETDARLEMEASIAIRELLSQLAATSRRFAQVAPHRQLVNRPGQVYSLSAEIRRLSVRRTRRGYGLGPLAPVLWLLSLPTGQVETRVEIAVQVDDSLGRRVWSETLRQRRSRIRGLYFNSNWRKVLIEDLKHGLRQEWRRVLPSLRESLP